MKKVGIVIPVFNEEQIVEELLNKLISSTESLPYNFEFLLVDDGSSDNTLNLLLKIQKKENRLKIIKLSRNWGHQSAFNAGLDYVDGDAVILMDGDLEDPPEVVPLFIKKWEEGFDVVYAVKETRHESKFKKLMFSIFYNLMERFSDIAVDKQAGMFSLIDKKAVEALKKFREKNKYYVGLRTFVGFKKINVRYHRDKRYAGAPKQTFRKLMNYALDAFFSFSFFPIRLLTYFGFSILVIITLFSCFLMAVKILRLQLWFFHDLPGWSSIVLIILFILGVQILFLGVIGEYIARIFDEVRNRPYYIVEDIFENKRNDEK